MSDRDECASEPTCPGCGYEIDPTTCGCGTAKDRHNAYEDGHAFVPLGCECFRAARTEEPSRG